LPSLKQGLEKHTLVNIAGWTSESVREKVDGLGGPSYKLFLYMPFGPRFAEGIEAAMKTIFAKAGLGKLESSTNRHFPLYW
jgi:hypothetical protein